MVGSSKRVSILVLSLGDLARSGHLVKLAETLTGAGFDVVRLGLKVGSSDPLEEQTDAGSIIRLDSTGSTQNSDADVAARSRRWAARSWAKSLLFRFASGRRLRDGVLLRRAYRNFMSTNERLYERGLAVDADLVINLQLTTLPAAARIAQDQGIPHIYDCRDLSVESGWSGFDETRFARLERRLIGEADLVVAAAPRMAARIAELYRVPSPVVIYNGSVKRALTATPAHQPMRILFQGRFASNRRLPELIQAIGMLQDSAVLTVQGWGEMEPELRELVGRLGLEASVRFAAPVDPMEASVAASEHDVGVINYLGSTNNLMTTVPMKLFDYLGGGLAIAASDIPPLRDIVESCECGVLFEPGDPVAIADALGRLIDNPQLLNEMKASALEAWQGYSWQRQGELYLEHVRRLLARAGPVA